MLTSLLGIVAAQAASVTTPPPVVLYTPSHGYPSRSASPLEPVRSAIFDVEVRGGDQLLWSGPMRVSTQNGASLDHRQSDAPPAQCAASERGYDNSNRQLLSISLSMRDGPASLVSARVTWERQLDSTDCRGGSRTVSFNETFPLEAGSSKTIKADGGLTVTLRQR
ncbi:hypothetical protein [Sphingomonas sp. BK580]|uniref:hypothetical protein n=1 Tax=Sphingomonas sp. BK580 TaxID=2586972 RepID=UPI0016175CC5|nr:hypothetical protein [Sphingomonas sp. BK580]MBB3695414.1 hypothetical protein [Sphingomonas sp. BK580]